MRLAGRVAAILTLEAVSLAAADSNDWLVIPGKRVGPITRTSTRSDMVRSFGSKNVVDGDVTLSEEGPEPGTTVFGDDPEQSLTIIWNDEGHVASITFCQRASKCRWHTEDGITLGTGLKALERTNGRAFRLYGFDWDYGGTVVSWEEGKLERLQRGTCGGLGLTLEPMDNLLKPDKQKLLREVQGDVEYSSSHPAMQALDIRVAGMSFTFGLPDVCVSGPVSLLRPVRSETVSATICR